MKLFILLLLIFFGNATAKDVYVPVLSKEEVTSISNEFLSENTEVELEKFEPRNVGFVSSPSDPYSNQWYLIYQRKTEIVNGQSFRRTNWFTVYLTNNQKPEIKLVWGY